jgi:predicted RNase H-like HicB family nuclease
MRRKTMVHVPELLGCMANGPTTEAAIAATPEAIRAYLRFLQRTGQDADPDAPFTTTVAEHVTEGVWLGNGSPYVTYAPDLEPVSEAELDMLVRRFHALREELARWAESQTPRDLDAPPKDGGRTARHILLHTLGATHGYVAAAIGGTTGFSRISTLAERGQLPIAGALREVDRLVVERLSRVTPEERKQVIQRPKEVRTLRKALRRMLEHDWEHLRELSRRPGGPEL